MHGRSQSLRKVVTWKLPALASVEHSASAVELSSEVIESTPLSPPARFPSAQATQELSQGFPSPSCLAVGIRTAAGEIKGWSMGIIFATGRGATSCCGSFVALNNDALDTGRCSCCLAAVRVRERGGGSAARAASAATAASSSHCCLCRVVASPMRRKRPLPPLVFPSPRGTTPQIAGLPPFRRVPATVGLWPPWLVLERGEAAPEISCGGGVEENIIE